MSWTMAGIRAGLATRLGTLTPTVVVYSQWPAQPVVPSALIGLTGDNPVDYDDSVDEAATLRLTVTVLVQQIVTTVAADTVDAFIDPSGAGSVRAALNASKSAGVWDFVIVKGAGRYGQYEFGADNPQTGAQALRYLGVEFNLEVGVS